MNIATQLYKVMPLGEFNLHTDKALTISEAKCFFHNNPVTAF